MQEYVYEVLEDWEFTADDGSTYYFRPQWKKPAVKKAAADGTVELELFMEREWIWGSSII